MSKFDDVTTYILKAWFQDYLSPTDEQFASFIKACEEGIECHEHVAGGGPGSGTGNAAPVTLPNWIPDGLLYNLWAFRRLLTVSPPVGANFVPSTWVGGAGETLTTPTAGDRQYLYVGLDTEPASVLKLRRDTLRHVATWTAREGENNCQALVLHEGLLYAAVQHATARVIKISPQSMERVDYWIGAGEDQNCVTLVTEGKFVYAGMATSTWSGRKPGTASQGKTVARPWTSGRAVFLRGWPPCPPKW